MYSYSQMMMMLVLEAGFVFVVRIPAGKREVLIIGGFRETGASVLFLAPAKGGKWVEKAMRPDLALFWSIIGSDRGGIVAAGCGMSAKEISKNVKIFRRRTWSGYWVTCPSQRSCWNVAKIARRYDWRERQVWQKSSALKIFPTAWSMSFAEWKCHMGSWQNPIKPNWELSLLIY